MKESEKDEVEEELMKTTTICSTMFCYEYAWNTDDPSKPPFCEKCKAKKK